MAGICASRREAWARALVHGSAQLDVDTVGGGSCSSSTDARGASLMAARTKSKVTPKYKTKYRVKNWAA